MGVTRYFCISSRRPLETVATLSEALGPARAGGYVWVDVTDPTREDLAALEEPLGIHSLAIEDCLDDDQVPKMEEFPGNTFILFNRYRYRDGRVLVEEVNFFLGERFLISVHSHAGGDPDLAERLESMARRDLEGARKGPDFLLQILLDNIVDEKFAAIEALQDELDQAEEQVLRAAADFRPEALMRLRRSLLHLRKSLVYEREILVRICRRDSPFVSEKAVIHFRDIYDHLAKFFEVIELCREMIASLMEIHLSMINNQMAMVGNRTNRVVRRLTVINTIFMPLTLLAGIGGMSEWSMMTGAQNWRIAYPAFLVAMAVIGAANYYLIRWMDARDEEASAATLPHADTAAGSGEHVSSKTACLHPTEALRRE